MTSKRNGHCPSRLRVGGPPLRHLFSNRSSGCARSSQCCRRHARFPTDAQKSPVEHAARTDVWARQAEGHRRSCSAGLRGSGAVVRGYCLRWRHGRYFHDFGAMPLHRRADRPRDEHFADCAKFGGMDGPQPTLYVSAACMSSVTPKPGAEGTSENTSRIWNGSSIRSSSKTWVMLIA